MIFFQLLLAKHLRMPHTTSTQGSALELSCWVVSGIIVLGVIFVIMQEVMRATGSSAHGRDGKTGVSAGRAAPSTRGRRDAPRNRQYGPANRPTGTTARIVEPAPPSEPSTDARYDDSGLFLLPAQAAPEPPISPSDTSQFFVDSGADSAAFQKTDKQKAMLAANIKPAMLAASDTGSANSVPSRTIGAAQISWMTMVTNQTEKPRTIGSDSVPFGSSSHLESARSGFL